MNITQRQMRAFLAVVRFRHFTRAAEQVHITQAGLSAMMKDLEAQLDCRLFDRTTRSVALTDEARQLVPVATQLLAELEAVRDAVHRVSSQERSQLTVGVTPTIAASVMPAVCKAFSKLHPEVSLRVSDIGRQAIQEGVATGALDVGFGAFFKPATGLERRAIAVFTLTQICAIDRPGGVTPAQPRRRRWTEIGNGPFLALPRGNPIQILIEEQLHRVGLSGSDHVEFENIQTLMAMAEADLGSAILPSFVARAARRLALAQYTLVEPKVTVSYFQITRKGRPPAPAIARLASILQTELGGGVVTSARRRFKVG